MARRKSSKSVEAKSRMAIALENPLLQSQMPVADTSSETLGLVREHVQTAALLLRELKHDQGSYFEKVSWLLEDALDYLTERDDFEESERQKSLLEDLDAIVNGTPVNGRP